MTTTFTVLQVAEHIDRKVSEAWDSHFWVRGEVAGLRPNASGVQYFDLVDTDASGSVVAKLPVSVLPGKWRLVQRRLLAVGQPLANGLQVRIKAQLSFWVKGGRLSLTLSDIDPQHTAGAIVLARRKLLEQMSADGTAQAQRRLPAPRLPLRLGVVTSADSQAFHDLIAELGASSLPFDVTVVPSLVQGARAPDQLVDALATVAGISDVDLVLLTRGGGAEVDLMTFDDPRVARAVASCPVPVWTGIGHHLDSPVAEQVAARGLKTPTALAQAVVQTVQAAEQATEDLWTAIRGRADGRLRHAGQRLDAASGRTRTARLVLTTASGRLDRVQHQIGTGAARQIVDRHTQLSQGRQQLLTSAERLLRHAGGRVDQADTAVAIGDPDRLIARGWSVTTDTDDRLVSGPVPVGTRLRTRTRGGIIASTVIKDHDAEESPDAEED